MLKILYLISGTSGSGKSTIMNSIMDNQVVSFTTRAARTNEVNGRDYVFITDDDFQDLLNNDGLIEYTQYSNNFYGITRLELETKLSKGNAFSIVDYNGMKQLKELYPNCVSIYIFVEKEDAEKQMRARGDSEDLIKKRLSTYEKEIDELIHYDFVIRNKHGELEETIEKIKDIILEGE